MLGLLIPVAVMAVLLGFFTALNDLQTGRDSEGKQQLEDSLRRAAVACYAAEGFYPPDVSYLVDHYGLQYDGDVYWVHYELFASNLMPDITVIEKGK